ncbi:lipid-A-disaccharide synthase [Abditibacteriota bacterium]|nr:lipid-A-disaccharide synthase [Abditibacteriota bacterium]
MRTLFLAVGDASGDEHCAALVREIKRRHPDWHIVALAGPRCAEAGAQILGSTQGLGVIGFASALAMVPRSWRLKNQMLQWLRTHKADAAIFCDWGGFNTRVLPYFKQAGVPILYYFPPRSWQKQGEAGTGIAPFCDAIATPFEWSAEKLQRVGANAHWVGHPILEKTAELPEREELRAQFGFSPDDVVVALLAGSRDMELKCIAPHLCGAISLLVKQKLPASRRFRFVFATPRGGRFKIERYLLGVKELVEAPVEGRTLELLRAADVGIIKSGTSTLEAAALNLPQIVVYDFPPLMHLQVALTGLRRKIRFVAMPNIILDRAAVPELLGENCRAPRIASQLMSLLESSTEIEKMKADYELVRHALGSELPLGATEGTVDMLERLVS